MLLLLGFALLAGAGTALSPCVLPVLPAVLSAGGVGGRRRPLGVVIGLSVTFPVTIVGIAEVVCGVGLGRTELRAVAVVVLAGFGGARSCRPSRRGSSAAGGAARLRAAHAGRRLRLRPARRRRARVRLRAVRGAGARRGRRRSARRRGRTVAVAPAYALGSAAVLFAIGLGGRRVLAPRARAGALRVQRAMGAVMLATALLIVTNVDMSFETVVARHISDISLTASLERSRRGDSRRLHVINGRRPKFTTPVPAGLTARERRLPELVAGTQRWFNTPGDPPLTLAALRGRGRARRLLDLHLHQLPAHAALPRGVGRALPRTAG